MCERSEVLNVILSHCVGVLDEQAIIANDGFQIYQIDLYGVELMIEAKRIGSVVYTYLIRSYDRHPKISISTMKGI